MKFCEYQTGKKKCEFNGDDGHRCYASINDIRLDLILFPETTFKSLKRAKHVNNMQGYLLYNDKCVAWGLPCGLQDNLKEYLMNVLSNKPKVRKVWNIEMIKEQVGEGWIKKHNFEKYFEDEEYKTFHKAVAKKLEKELKTRFKINKLTFNPFGYVEEKEEEMNKK